MNGSVAPSANSASVLRTCCGLSESSRCDARDEFGGKRFSHRRATYAADVAIATA